MYVRQDLNGDGSADLVTTHSNSVSVLPNLGDGSFARPVNYRVGRSGYWGGRRPVAIGDLNRDGAPDGTFRRSRVRRAGSWGRGRRPVAIGDLNRDGAADLAVVSEQGVSLLLNRGAGSFGGRLDYGTGARPGDSAAAAIADFDGDGQLDLAVENVRYRRSDISSDLAVLLNRPGLCNVQWVRG